MWDADPVGGTAVIDERFCGPPGSGNGGYACALTAQFIQGPAEVTLRKPPPLGKALTVVVEEQSSSMLDGDVLVATAKPTSVDVEIPSPISLADAELAASRFPWRDRHPYPTCFVCGPLRQPGDGLGIYPGPVEGRDLFAAPWTPATDLAGSSGEVREEFVWASLDCPSGIVTDLFRGVGLILLGRLSVDIRHPIRADRPHVLLAWTLSRDGRKLNTASALFSADGALCAVGRAVWIEVPAAPS